MKPVAAFVVIVILFLLLAMALAASDHIEYNIGIYEDGSALFTVIHVTDIDSVVDSWEDFEQRLIFTIDTAKDETDREMALDFSSLEMSIQMNWETSSKTIRYIFLWENFSLVEQGQISFGDVCNKSFFSLLYGDGELYVTYPPEYVLSPASVRPNQLDDSTQTLHWYRTQDFLAGTHIVLLEIRDAGSSGFLNLFTMVLLGSGGIGILAVGFFVLKQRRRQRKQLSELGGLPPIRESESDQDRILQLLESSGGSLKQSEVGNMLGFSRAKTSLLLAEMEKNSLLRRIKKGKTKIVFRLESNKGDNL